MAITSASQAEDVGSIPITRSILASITLQSNVTTLESLNMSLLNINFKLIHSDLFS
jgi:hypothetical protein